MPPVPRREGGWLKQAPPLRPLQVIALTCTNAPGVQRRQLRFFTEGEAEAEAGLARQGDDAAAEEEEQEERPKKRQRKGKEKVGAKPAAKAAGPSQAPKTKAGKLAVEAAERAVAEEVPAAPPAASGPRGTLIVCPLSVMSNWQMQLEEHTQGKLSGGRGRGSRQRCGARHTGGEVQGEADVTACLAASGVLQCASTMGPTATAVWPPSAATTVSRERGSVWLAAGTELRAAGYPARPLGGPLGRSRMRLPACLTWFESSPLHPQSSSPHTTSWRRSSACRMACARWVVSCGEQRGTPQVGGHWGDDGRLHPLPAPGWPAGGLAARVRGRGSHHQEHQHADGQGGVRAQGGAPLGHHRHAAAEHAAGGRWARGLRHARADAAPDAVKRRKCAGPPWFLARRPLHAASHHNPPLLPPPFHTPTHTHRTCTASPASCASSRWTTAPCLCAPWSGPSRRGTRWASSACR